MHRIQVLEPLSNVRWPFCGGRSSLDDAWILRKTMCAAGLRGNPYRSLCLAAVFALPLCLLGCGNQEQTSASARTIQVSSELAAEQILNRHLEADPRTLDPSLMTDVVGQIVLDDLFEGLVTLNEEGTYRSWRCNFLGNERGRKDLDVSSARKRPMVQRRAGHGRRFRICLAPPGGSGNGVGVRAGADTHRKCHGRCRR